MSKPKLPREIGKFSAMMIGLGSIIGTGAFVSIGIAAGISERFLFVSIFFAFLLALCSAISSAQLAANHPVSGGTYEYGRKYLNNYLGFMSGWVFVFAKCASGAAAALTFGGYLTSVLGLDNKLFIVLIALMLILLLSLVLLYGIRKTTTVNNVIVFVSISSILFFIIIGAISYVMNENDYSSSAVKIFNNEEIFKNVLYSTAIIFVAFTGYGRIATLGEEIKDPRKNIPGIILLTLLIAFVLYMFIALVSTKLIGYTQFSIAATSRIAPLVDVSDRFLLKGSNWVIAAGAFFAITGVLLNLMLGISRVLFAMGRNGDLPRFLSTLSHGRHSPVYSILASNVIICIILFLGDIKTTWSFSAFSVLIYYGITNLSALRLSKKERFFPKSISHIGLFFCILIAFYIDFEVVKTGLILITLGTIYYIIRTRTKSISGKFYK